MKLVFGVLTSLALSSGVYGQYVTETKLIASDGAVDDLFGSSVSISADYAVIGARFDDDNGTDSGSAYIFERDVAGNWLEAGKVTASDGAVNDQFGYSVSIAGDYAVVGAGRDDDDGTDSGSAYVFECDELGNWIEVQKLTASDGELGDLFGDSVAVSDNYAVIGAFGDDDNGSLSGSAYVFERDGAGNWSEVAKLMASDGALNDYFGSSVSISGDYVVISAYGDDTVQNETGSAYVFERDGAGNWSEVAKLIASDAGANDRFGYSVSISGDYAVIGSYLDDHGGGDNSGSAYIFERNRAGNWSEAQKLTASDGMGSDNFGHSVSISGDYAVIGAYGNGGNGDQSGSAYLFERDSDGNWSEAAKLTASDGAEFDAFGWSVSIFGNYALIGANGGDDNGSNSGSAYVYTIEEAAGCPGDATGDLVVNLVDFSQLLVDFGSTDGSAADFNGDNIVDLADFSILLINYGNECNSPLRAAPTGGSKKSPSNERSPLPAR